jgi:hypothetical protein
MLTLNREVVTTDTDYGTALLDQRSGRYWTLNPTAALILRVLLSGGDPPRAARALLDEYDVAPATARADVDRLVGELRTAGLLIGSVSSSGIAPPGDTGPGESHRVVVNAVGDPPHRQGPGRTGEPATTGPGAARPPATGPRRHPGAGASRTLAPEAWPTAGAADGIRSSLRAAARAVGRRATRQGGGGRHAAPTRDEGEGGRAR